MFYNTGISTYVWIVSNCKPEARRGKVQLIDASAFWQKMRKSLGSKRKEMGEEHIAIVTRLFGSFVEAQLATVLDADGKQVERQVVVAGERLPGEPGGGAVRPAPISRIFANEDFGYRTITVERPLRDDQGKIVLGERDRRRLDLDRLDRRARRRGSTAVMPVFLRSSARHGGFGIRMRSSPKRPTQSRP